MMSSGYLYRDGMARPHDEKGQLIPGRMTTAVEAARYGSSGQLHSTVKDYAKFLIEIIEPKPADAFRLSTTSLHEMLPVQVREYFRLIQHHGPGGHFYTKQWKSWYNPVDGVQTDAATYPYPPTWERLFERTPVAQPAFFEALFAV